MGGYPAGSPDPALPSHPSQEKLCPWPHRLSGFPLTTLWASSIKWVDARAVEAHGGGEFCSGEACLWIEPHPLLGWPPAGYSLTLETLRPFPQRCLLS